MRRPGPRKYAHAAPGDVRRRSETPLVSSASCSWASASAMGRTANCPVAFAKSRTERLTYDRAAKAVTYRSDKSEGPTAGTETADPLEFLARVLVHIPDKGHGTTRLQCRVSRIGDFSRKLWCTVHS